MEVFCESPIFVKALCKDAQKLHLTDIDQLLTYYYPSVLFYTYNGKKAEDPVEAVRRGVEEMVAQHYPWAAGRMQAAEHGGDGCRFEVCINEDGGPGIQFVSACANCPLTELGDLSLPNPAFDPLFVKVDDNIPLPSRPLVALQVTKFEDGAFCVSMSSHHALFDGVAASIFLQNTSSCARGEGLCIQMDKAPREQRIKPSGTSLIQLRGPCWLTEERYVKELAIKSLAATKFEFLKEELAQLRVQALSKQQDCNAGFKSCSLFQVLAAHLWRAKARSMPPLIICQDPISNAFPLRIVVNLRERIIAGIPHNYMGNALSMATALASIEELKEKSLAFAVEKIQEAIRQVTPESFQSEVDYLQILGGNARFKPAIMVISSLAGLGFYETDFGWGKPAYFGRHYAQLPNLFNILDGNAQFISLNILAHFNLQDELERFQDALNLDLAG